MNECDPTSSEVWSALLHLRDTMGKLNRAEYFTLESLVVQPRKKYFMLNESGGMTYSKQAL